MGFRPSKSGTSRTGMGVGLGVGVEVGVGGGVGVGKHSVIPFETYSGMPRASPKRRNLSRIARPFPNANIYSEGHPLLFGIEKYIPNASIRFGIRESRPLRAGCTRCAPRIPPSGMAPVPKSRPGKGSSSSKQASKREGKQGKRQCLSQGVCRGIIGCQCQCQCPCQSQSQCQCQCQCECRWPWRLQWRHDRAPPPPVRMPWGMEGAWFWGEPAPKGEVSAMSGERWAASGEQYSVIGDRCSVIGVR
jgi:hypothetical protein